MWRQASGGGKVYNSVMIIKMEDRRQGLRYQEGNVLIHEYACLLLET